MSRGRGPERHGPEGTRRAAGQPRASPSRESRLESAGAGRAHGEAGPRPLSYGHQVRGPWGTVWELAREGQWASGRVCGGTFPGGGGDGAEGMLAIPGDARERKFPDPPCSTATSASCFMSHLVPGAWTPPNCLGSVTFTLGGLALQVLAFSQPWGALWAFDPDPSPRPGLSKLAPGTGPWGEWAPVPAPLVPGL